MTEPLISVRDLRVSFATRQGALKRNRYDVTAVDGIDLSINAGEVMGLVGESGCGKTTTGRAILRLQKITGGTVRFRGTDISSMSKQDSMMMHRQVQAVFQDPYDSLDPRLTIGRIVAEPLVIHGLFRGKRRERILEVLETVGLDQAVIAQHPNELSGGQRQRVGIARALAPEPSFLVCDEPVSALDVSVQAQVIGVFRRLSRELGLAYLFIGHDLSVVRYLSDRIAVMYAGKIVEIGESTDVVSRALHPYTKALLASVPVPDPRIERARRDVDLVVGETPSLVRPPSGCRFHPRCPFARQRCKDEVPQLDVAPGGHLVACHFWREISGTAAGQEKVIVVQPHPS